MAPYKPTPVDTSHVVLPEELLELTELLARSAHDVWSLRRFAEGWVYGPARDDAKKEHPCLLPYEDLPASEKQYDRDAALETIKAILALGFRIEKPATSGERGPASK